MKRNVQQTSIDCYRQHVIMTLPGQHAKIAAYLISVERATRGMIAEFLGVNPSSMTQAVQDLINAKTIYVIRDEQGEPIKEKCPVSPKHARTQWMAHSANIKQSQSELFNQ